MKFKLSQWETEEYNIIEFVDQILHGRDYDRGAIETVEATSQNTLESFGRLLQILADKEVLNRAEIYKIVMNDDNEVKKAVFGKEK